MALTLPASPTITASNETSLTVDLSWGSASASGTVSYLVYYYASAIVGDMDTISKCQTVGTLFNNTAQIDTSVTVTGLTVDTDYVFCVVPLENGISEASKIYTSMTTATSSTPAAPQPGDNGDLYVSALGSSSTVLNWTKATDDVTDSSLLTYRVFYSLLDNLDSQADMIANGTEAGSATVDINTKTVDGLDADTAYYLNVYVEDGDSNYGPYITTKIKTPASETLKEEYLEGGSGMTDKMAAVFAAGVAFVSNNRAAILADLQTAASKGKTSFTSSHLTSFETDNLRLEGRHMDTYFAGIIKGFADEYIYSYEVTPSLDTSDTSETSVILTFSL